MLYFSITLAILSQAGVLSYLHRQSSEIKDTVTLSLIHCLGLYSVWWNKISTDFPIIWLLLAFVLYQWLFAKLLLYLNKKIKQQNMSK
jgi:hypothetical protein